MKIGSLFSGIGGLDLACEQVFDAQTVWQVEREPYCQKVLAARWPDAQRFDDITQVSADVLQPVDVLCGGFPCQDLSIAGKRAGLDGARSGLYSEMMRLVSELRPQFVVFENVPALMKYRERVHDDLAALGYGSRWQMCQASDVGAPHRRRRVFVLAIRDASGCIVLPRPSEQHDLFAPAWQVVNPGALWPTATASFFNQKRDVYRERFAKHKARGFHCGKPLNIAAIELEPDQDDTKLLNPQWVELLMGFACGWSDASQSADTAHAWPLPRGAKQAPHEPPRVIVMGASSILEARLRALGNAVVPQQAAAALTRMLAVQP
jgi:DNA (cytosine-5)-methyltransferase 1